MHNNCNKQSNIKSVCILNLNDKMDKCWLLITLCFYGKWPAPNTIGSLGEIQLTIFEKYIKKKEVMLFMEDVLLAAAIGYFNDLSSAACYLIYPTHSLSCAFMPPLII